MFKELIEADTAESTTYSAVSMTAYGRKQFDEDSEEDAADFLRYLLNELVEEMGASNANNVMKAMFEMRACESMKCSHDQCERLPGTDQSEVAIILVYLTDLAFDPVSGCKDVKYAMENITFGVEEMRQYPCSECGNIGTLRKQKILTQLPNVLMLHLQRFRRDTNGFRHKNTERVTFQMRMDMTSYFVDGTEREIASYDLKGVIIHIHKTINGEVSGFDSGHYVAYVKVSVMCEVELVVCRNGCELLS
jgi:ubiquitin C-terminal hydrolase